MRRRWTLTATVALAIIGLAAMLATDDRDLAYTLGVRPLQVAAVLNPGQEACQRPILVSAPADSVEFQVGSKTAGPPLDVAVRSQSGAPGEARVPGGYRGTARERVQVSGIREGRSITLCIRDAGRSRLALYGGPAPAAPTSALFVDGVELPVDLTLVFRRGHSRTALSLFETIFSRASLFHPGWSGAWIFWVLLAAVVIGVPLLLGFGLPRD
jgi:hypothetical protein